MKSESPGLNKYIVQSPEVGPLAQYKKTTKVYYKGCSFLSSAHSAIPSNGFNLRLSPHTSKKMLASQKLHPDAEISRAKKQHYLVIGSFFLRLRKLFPEPLMDFLPRCLAILIHDRNETSKLAGVGWGMAYSYLLYLVIWWRVDTEHNGHLERRKLEEDRGEMIVG